MRSRWLVVLLILLAAGVGAFVYFRNLQPNDGILHASGTIEATKVDVSFQIGARVAAVTATEGQPLKAGDVLPDLQAAFQSPVDMARRSGVVLGSRRAARP